jgi:ribosomal protein L36
MAVILKEIREDKKIKIICKKLATFKKKQGDFNFA